MNTCKDCQHWHKLPRDPNNLAAPRMGECREGPPPAFGLPVVNQFGQQAIQWHIEYTKLPEQFTACGRFKTAFGVVENGQLATR